YYRKATARVAIRTARPREVVVLGALPQAGRRKLAGGGTLLDVLGEAGFGTKAESVRGHITISRSGHILTLPARDVFALADSRWNLVVQPDDVIIVQVEDPV